MGSLTTMSAGNVREIDYIASHPNYNPVTNEHDIALVHVYPHLLFSTNIALGSFADGSYIPRYNQSVWAIGWGQMNVSVLNYFNKFNMHAIIDTFPATFEYLLKIIILFKKKKI